jgi:hypothetical protein
MKHAAMWLLCAWVLWTSGSGVGGRFTDKPEIIWPAAAFETKAECESGRAQQIAGVLASTLPGVKAFRTGDMITVTTEPPERSVFNYTYVCLPDTVDPRARR